MKLIDGDKLKRKCQRVATEAWKLKITASVESILNQFIDYIDEAPTIEVPTWIPCSEREPNEFEDVLVCLTDGTMAVLYLTDYIDIWGKPKWFDRVAGGCVLYSETIAWMPLPEPYGEREGE